MIQNKNILVAGGTGLVGSNLTKKLVELGANVRSTYFSKPPPFLKEVYRRFDFTEFDDCLEATKDMQYVFICAAQSFGFGSKIMKENPTAIILPNLRINSGLFEACRLIRLRSSYLSAVPLFTRRHFIPSGRMNWI